MAKVHQLIGVGTIIAVIVIGVAIMAFGISAAVVFSNNDVVIGLSAVSAFLAAVEASLLMAIYVYIRGYYMTSLNYTMSKTMAWVYGGAWFWFIILVLGSAIGALVIGERGDVPTQRKDGVIALSTVYAALSFVGVVGVFWGWYVVKEHEKRSNMSMRSSMVVAEGGGGL